MTRRPYFPISLRSPRAPVRLWPRTRRINRHIIDRSLAIAAWGSHTCRSFEVKGGAGPQ